MFMTLLAICHTIVPEREKDNPESIVYQGASPGNAGHTFYKCDFIWVWGWGRPRHSVKNLTLKSAEII